MARRASQCGHRRHYAHGWCKRCYRRQLRGVTAVYREAEVSQVTRGIAWSTPAQRLVAAVIVRAILDLETGGKHAASAAAYIYDRRSEVFAGHCAALGLSPQHVRRLIAMAGPEDGGGWATMTGPTAA